MNWLKTLRTRFRALFRKRELDREMDAELRSHIEMRTQANIEAGMNPEEARFAALRQFGWTESIKEECREARLSLAARYGAPLLQDLRFALRQLRNSPGFTAVAVLTLALGIGANTAIFTLVNAVLLKPIQARKPGELAGLYSREKAWPDSYRFFSYPEFREIQQGQTVFQDIIALRPATVGMVEGDLTREIRAQIVSANYFAMLGVTPALGRGFRPEEETAYAPVALLSYSSWKRLGSDLGLVGRTLRLNRADVTIVGVAPEGFTGTQAMESPELYLPLGAMLGPLMQGSGDAPFSITDPAQRRWSLVARLNPGVSMDEASTSLRVISDRWAAANPEPGHEHEFVVMAARRLGYSNAPDRGGKAASLVAVVMGNSGLVLLAACLNLANLLLARGAARRREIAIRMAVGASRGGILRQLLTEGLLLSLIGGVAGIVLSFWGTQSLARLFTTGPEGSLLVFDPVPDVRILLATLSFCVLATLLFALGPAWKLIRIDVHADLKSQTGTETGRRSGRWSLANGLVVGQVAVSVALVTAAGMFTLSAIKALQANPGFAFGANFYAQIDTTLGDYAPERASALFREIGARVRALPGVEAASFSLTMPFGSVSHGQTVSRAGEGPARPGGEGGHFTGFNVIGHDYFRTLGVPLLRGREFERREFEAAQSPPVAILDQRLAERLWPGENAVGKRLQGMHTRGGQPAPAMEVVGVVPALRHGIFEKSDGNQPRPMLYVPFGQDFHPNMQLQVRVPPGTNPAGLMRQVRQIIREIDANLPVTDLQTLQAQHQNGMSIRVTTLGASLFGAFGLAALLLTIIGVYGVKAHAVSRRTREIGVRMALGASRAAVSRRFLWDGMRLTMIGLLLGLCLAAGVGQVASAFVYGVRALEPAILVSALFLLTMASLAACWLPARRAARVDPMVALRAE